MGLTKKGEEMFDVLAGRVREEAERKGRAARETANRWAQDQVIRLGGQWLTTDFGESVEVIGFASPHPRTNPDSDDALRLAALERELGVTFAPADITRGTNSDRGGNAYAISMTPGAFYEFLQRHKQPS